MKTSFTILSPHRATKGMFKDNSRLTRNFNNSKLTPREGTS